MIFDRQTLFSWNQAVTADGASSNVIDLGPIGILRDIGKGCCIPIRIQVTEAFAGNTSLKVQVQVSDTENFSSPVTVAESPAIPVASLKAGYAFNLEYVPRYADKRYMRLYYDVDGTPSAGKVSAGITMGNQSNHE